MFVLLQAFQPWPAQSRILGQQRCGAQGQESICPGTQLHNLEPQRQPSHKFCPTTTLAIAKVKLQTIPNQDPGDWRLKNQQNKLRKMDYRTYLVDSIRKYNMNNGADLQIENITMNLMMSILCSSQIPTQRLESLHPVIIGGPEHGKENSGEEGRHVAFRLPIKVLQEDLHKRSLENLDGEEVLMWGLCGSNAAHIADILRSGLTKAGHECYDGKWCWALECVSTHPEARGQMQVLLEKFKQSIDVNVVNVAVEVMHCGRLVRGLPPQELAQPREIFRSRRKTRSVWHAFLPTDAVVTGLIFYNPTSGELPGWPADLDFDEFDYEEDDLLALRREGWDAVALPKQKRANSVRQPQMSERDGCLGSF